MNSEDNTRLTEEVGRIEELIGAVESSADPAVRNQVRQLVRSILDLHRAGLGKLLNLIAQAGESGQTILDACIRDDLVQHLLLLHDLHPQVLEARVRQVLTRLEPASLQHGGRVELVSVADAVVRLRIHWERKGGTSSPALETIVEGTILESTPDVERVEFEGVPRYAGGLPLTTIPLPLVGANGRRPR